MNVKYQVKLHKIIAGLINITGFYILLFFMRAYNYIKSLFLSFFILVLNFLSKKMCRTSFFYTSYAYVCRLILSQFFKYA